MARVERRERRPYRSAETREEDKRLEGERMICILLERLRFIHADPNMTTCQRLIRLGH